MGVNAFDSGRRGEEGRIEDYPVVLPVSCLPRVCSSRSASTVASEGDFERRASILLWQPRQGDSFREGAKVGSFEGKFHEFGEKTRRIFVPGQSSPCSSDGEKVHRASYLLQQLFQYGSCSSTRAAILQGDLADLRLNSEPGQYSKVP